jgi:predicted phosphohydrolase
MAVRPDCKQMRKELTELRLEYHDFAKGNHDTWSEITFKRLCEILDEIVQLKQRMRESNCAPMSRKKNLEKALKERDANAAKKETSESRRRDAR